MAEKQISNNQLARMIKKGFDNTPTKEQFENFEKRIGSVETSLNSVEKRLTSVDERLKKVETVLTDARVL
jgi:predicted  nucleic acid-binding Zn-ribbon protein